MLSLQISGLTQLIFCLMFSKYANVAVCYEKVNKLSMFLEEIYRGLGIYIYLKYKKAFEIMSSKWTRNCRNVNYKVNFWSITYQAKHSNRIFSSMTTDHSIKINIVFIQIMYLTLIFFLINCLSPFYLLSAPPFEVLIMIFLHSGCNKSLHSINAKRLNTVVMHHKVSHGAASRRKWSNSKSGNLFCRDVQISHGSCKAIKNDR